MKHEIWPVLLFILTFRALSLGEPLNDMPSTLRRSQLAMVLTSDAALYVGANLGEFLTL